MVSPLLSAMAIAVGAAALHGRVRPRLAATLSMVGIVGVAVAVVPTATVLAVASWCICRCSGPASSGVVR